MTTVQGMLTEDRRNESWELTKAAHTPSRQEAKILEHLSWHGPMTSRDISDVTGIERTSVVRALKALVDARQVDDSMEIRCPVTGRNVTEYRIMPRSLRL